MESPQPEATHVVANHLRRDPAAPEADPVCTGERIRDAWLLEIGARHGVATGVDVKFCRSPACKSSVGRRLDAAWHVHEDANTHRGLILWKHSRYHRE